MTPNPKDLPALRVEIPMLSSTRISNILNKLLNCLSGKYQKLISVSSSYGDADDYEFHQNAVLYFDFVTFPNDPFIEYDKGSTFALYAYESAAFILEWRTPELFTGFKPHLPFQTVSPPFLTKASLQEHPNNPVFMASQQPKRKNPYQQMLDRHRKNQKGP